MRRERDFRFWKLVDAAVDGKVCLCISKGRKDAALEHGRVMGMLGDEGIEATRVRRSANFDICFEGGGMITFVSAYDVRMLDGMNIDIAMTTTSLSHWDRRDVEAFGAVWI